MDKHIIDADGIRSWVDDDNGKLYASDGRRKTFYVYLKLFGDPRFVVIDSGTTVYDGWDISDAVQTYNNL